MLPEPKVSRRMISVTGIDRSPAFAVECLVRARPAEFTDENFWMRRLDAVGHTEDLVDLVHRVIRIALDVELDECRVAVLTDLPVACERRADVCDRGKLFQRVNRVGDRGRECGSWIVNRALSTSTTSPTGCSNSVATIFHSDPLRRSRRYLDRSFRSRSQFRARTRRRQIRASPRSRVSGASRSNDPCGERGPFEIASRRRPYRASSFQLTPLTTRVNLPAGPGCAFRIGD